MHNRAGQELTRYNITPCAKVRQTQSDRWKKRPCVVKYRAFADECRRLKMELKDGDSVIFYIEMPASWSQKKRTQHTTRPHRSRPDLDNLLGGLMDAVMPEGDSHLSHLSSVRKVWSHKPGIEISNPYSEPQPYVSSPLGSPQSEPHAP